MTILLGLYLVAGTGSALKLDLRSPQTELLIGEPVKLTLTWKPSQKVEAHIEDDSQGLVHLRVWVDDGTGPKRYWEAGRAISETLVAATELQPGEEVVQNIVLLRGGYGEKHPGNVAGFVFPTKGHYTLKVGYGDATGLRAESNSISFDVKEPSGEDREVFELIRKDPDLLKTERGATLIQRYRKSVYLRRTKLLALQEREIELRDRKDPDSGASLWHLDKASLDAFQADHFRRMAQDLLADDDWGPFEEERLDLAAQYAAIGGDKASAERARGELIDRFPRSAAVKRMQEKEAASAAKKEKDEEPAKKPVKPNE